MADDVVIIDSGGANIASLVFALERLGARPVRSSDAAAIRGAARVILPGVGAAADAMVRLRKAGLVDVIRDLEQPLLGICLGMQLLAEFSEEDEATCVGVVPGTSTRLPGSPEFPVPNMGWCAIEVSRNNPLLSGIDDGAWFYFVHSYALPPSDMTIATARHSIPFSAALAHRNFYATQFHPERSASSGARVLRNFLELSL